MGMLRRKSTGGSVVEFSPATPEARVRSPASASFLHATILVPFSIKVFSGTQRTESRFGWNTKGQGTSGVAPKRRRGPD